MACTADQLHLESIANSSGFAQLGMALDIATLSLHNSGKPCTLTVPKVLSVSSEGREEILVPLLDINSKGTYLIQSGHFTISFGVLSHLDMPNATSDPCPAAVANVDHISGDFSPAVIETNINPAWRSVCQSGHLTTIEINQTSTR